jgi:signal transduction histidine kinase
MKRSTDSLIALQFLAVVVPIAFVLLAQMMADARRASALEHSRPLRTLANDIRASYRTFTNGAADAVDTGTLGHQSAEALQTTARLLRDLGSREEAFAVGDAPRVAGELAAQVRSGTTLDLLMPLRDRITDLDRKTRQIDEYFERRDAEVVRDAVESARRQKHEVTVALFISLFLTVIFVLAARIRLKRQLDAEANIERERRAVLERDIAERIAAQEREAVLQQQLRDASRHAGMAEVASSVLHNVGNVLNSVNVSADVAISNLRAGSLAGLHRVVALINEHPQDLGSFIDDDPRGRHLPVYLTELAKQLGSEQDKTLQEIESLKKNIAHIKEIVAMQQRYARVGGAAETIDVTHLVDESLRINQSAFQGHAITVVREFERVPQITVDKHKVLQILVNLVRNAKDACEAAGDVMKRVTVRVTQCARGVQVAVTDTGVGIPAENMIRIFNHGFTTKKSGHGFGLHSGALAARELGGELRVQSDGPGLGATFVLELPVTPP